MKRVGKKQERKEGRREGKANARDGGWIYESNRSSLNLNGIFTLVSYEISTVLV
jgi:hypothetical protein